MAVSHPKTDATLAPAGDAPRWAAWSAVAASIALAVVGSVDQLGAQALGDHAATLSAPDGRTAEPGLLYGLVYAVAAVDVVVSLPVTRAARSGRRWAPVLAVASAVVATGLAVTLLVAREYGQAVFPPVWGALALVPAAAATVTAVLLAARRR